MNTAARAAGAALAEGLQARGYRQVSALGHAAWEAERTGRTVRVSLLRRTRTRYVGELRSTQLLGLTVGVDCSTVVQSRLIWWVPLALMRNRVLRWLNRRRGLVPMHFPAVLPPDRGLLAHEPAWAEQVVASPAMEVVAALLEGVDGRPMRGSLMLQPGRWSYTGPVQQPEAISLDAVEQCINTLVELAERVEALPPPRRPVSPTALERWMQAHPVLCAVGLLLGCTAVLGLVMLALVVGIAGWLV